MGPDYSTALGSRPRHGNRPPGGWRARPPGANLPAMPLEIQIVPVLSDNYVWLAHEPRSGATAVVDPAVAAPVLAAATRRGWRISHILNTHHHGDHVGGNL